MGSFCVVVLPPILNDDPCFAQIESHLSAQTFIAESAEKAFDLVVLPWATWVDIDRLDRMILQALLDFIIFSVPPLSVRSKMKSQVHT